MKKVNLTVLLVLLIFGCREQVKSNKYYFEKYLKVNTAACASVFIKQNKNDSVAAVHYCACMLNKLYAIDSNSVKLKGEELAELINKNRDIISIGCDSLLLKK